MDRICKKCKQKKKLNIDNFPKRKSDKFGFDSICKECKREYDKKRYQANKERLKSVSKDYYRKNKEKRLEYQTDYYNSHKEYYSNYDKKWRKEHPIQRRIINGKHRQGEKDDKCLTDDQWIYTLNYFNNKCAYCGMTIDEHKEKFGEVLNQDHLIPISQGGKYRLGNIVPTCRSCNSKKCNKSFDDWYESSDVYNPLRVIRIHKFIKDVKDGI